METTILFIVYLSILYAVLGNLFAIIFLWKGIGKVDEDANGTSLRFKLIIWPGIVLFWPYLIYLWTTKKDP